VFVVVAHIKGEPIERSVIGVGLLSRLVDEMLGNKMTSHGVDAHA